MIIILFFWSSAFAVYFNDAIAVLSVLNFDQRTLWREREKSYNPCTRARVCASKTNSSRDAQTRFILYWIAGSPTCTRARSNRTPRVETTSCSQPPPPLQTRRPGSAAANSYAISFYYHKCLIVIYHDYSYNNNYTEVFFFPLVIIARPIALTDRPASGDRRTRTLQAPLRTVKVRRRRPFAHPARPQYL